MVVMRKYIIMGVQGSGKGTQAHMLEDGFDLVHINVGDILRWNVQNHTKLGARVRRLMEAGELARIVRKLRPLLCFKGA
jgi:adenylate kinase